VKLIGLLSWYAEDPAWLSEAIASHHRAGMTHLVAVDGAYSLYPDGQPQSDAKQHRAIRVTCKRLGVACTISVPMMVWGGDEIAKRSFMFQLGLQVADGPQDWFIVIDADHVMTSDHHLPSLLSDTDLHAAELMAWQEIDNTRAPGLVVPRINEFSIRLAFRANPGLRCGDDHSTYIDGEGRVLWGQRDAVPALDLTHVRVLHRTAQRDRARHASQYAYYNNRAASSSEFGSWQRCEWPDCPDPPVQTVPCEFEAIKGTHAFRAGGMKVCAKHARRAHYENERALAELNRGHKAQLALDEISRIYGRPMALAKLRENQALIDERNDVYGIKGEKLARYT